ncbi:hypothetical protein HYFRA_00003715 [Hymenoscyphus fraxineus]|uniref:ZZ-type domain-containing protein n=1 Tax=Hymenoscyphus fraxineus TaxID=746836 RepID=A0A9N9KXS3_9HELO|nr:hypothetical protein HYFRA_00003715 [Hymenoscyphus fraxineus]
MLPVLVELSVPYDLNTFTSEEIDEALIHVARYSHTTIVKSLLTKKRYSQGTLLESLKAATSSGVERTMLEIANHIAGISESSRITWPASLLYRAAFLGLDQFAKRLLELGCLPEPGGSMQTEHAQLTDTDGQSVLSWTMGVLRNPEVAQVLVGEGEADVNFADEKGFTALYTASDMGNYLVVESLLKMGADPNKVCGSWAPLLVAASEGYIESIRVLLEGGASPDIPNADSNMTPLSCAANKGYLDICRLLLSKGAGINSPLIVPPVLCDMLENYVGIHPNSTQLDVIKFLVENGADINAKDSDGMTALSNAVYLGNETVVQCLLENRADANIPDDLGRSALFFAAGQSQHRDKAVAFARSLLAHGADINLQTTRGMTPLMIAAWHNHTDFAEFLLEQPKTNVDSVSEGTSEISQGWTALSYAVSGGFREMIRLLADAGADLNRRGSHGLYPIHVLACRSADSLRTLLEYRRKVDIEAKSSSGMTALLLAVSSNPVELENVKVLINAGANLDATNEMGHMALSWTYTSNYDKLVSLMLQQEDFDINLCARSYGNALHQACKNGKLDLVKMLVDHGSDINLSLGCNHGTPLQCVCLASDDSNYENIKDMMRYLIANGADVKAEGGLFGSVIGSAAMVASSDAIRLLLEHGAPLDIMDDMERLPIHHASNNCLDVFKMLVKAGGDISVRDKLRRTTLHCAAQYGNAEVVEHLLEKMGPEAVHYTDIDGWTPLCWAVRGLDRYHDPHEGSIDRLKVVRLLLEHNADVYAQGTIGKESFSVLKIARYSNADPEIITLLRKGIREEGSTKHPGGSAEPRQDNSHKNVKPGAKRTPAAYCDYCHWSIRGIVYHCKTCYDFDFCNKCYHRRDIIHSSAKYSNHEFEEKGPEYDPTPPQSRKGSITSLSSSSSSSSSGWGAGSEDDVANKVSGIDEDQDSEDN